MLQDTLNVFIINYYPFEFLDLQNLRNFCLISKNVNKMMNLRAQITFYKRYPLLKNVPIPKKNDKFQSWVSLASAFIHSKLPQEVLQDFSIEGNWNTRFIPVVPCKNEFQILKGYHTTYIILPFVSYEINKNYPILYCESCENGISLKSFDTEQETKNEIMRNGFYSLRSLDISNLMDPFLQFSKITLLDERSMANLKMFQFAQKIKENKTFEIVFHESSIFMNEIIDTIKLFKINVEKADYLSRLIKNYTLSKNVSYIENPTLMTKIYNIFRKQEIISKNVTFDSIFIEIGINICNFLKLEPTFGNFEKVRKEGKWTSRSMSISLK